MMDLAVCLLSRIIGKVCIKAGAWMYLHSASVKTETGNENLIFGRRNIV
jgi:hypothetical protein